MTPRQIDYQASLPFFISNFFSFPSPSRHPTAAVCLQPGGLVFFHSFALKSKRKKMCMLSLLLLNFLHLLFLPLRILNADI